MHFRDIKKVLFFTFLCFNCLSAKAQKVNQFNSWGYYSGNYQLSEKIALENLLSWARNDFVKNWQQSNVRIGGNYAISRKVSVGGGYEWVVLFPYGAYPVPEKRPEHRIYEQIKIKSTFKKITFNSNILLEQRIRENITRHRLRLRLGMKTPLIRFDEGKTKLSVSVFNEFFFTIDQYANGNAYAQNRFYAGIDIPISTHIALGLGYLNQYISIDEFRQENNHTLMVGLFHKIDFGKKN